MGTPEPGVAAHFWAKRSRGLPEHAARAKTLLAFLEPILEERDPDAIKRPGRELKSFGEFYPELESDGLVEQVVHHPRHPRALMVRKSLTYLSTDQRARVAGKAH